LLPCSFHAATLLLSRRQAQAQKASPEYKTAKAVIEAKRRQIQGWQAALQARRQRGAAKVDAKGQYADRESRMLLHHITTTTRPVEMDEAEQKVGWVRGCVCVRKGERGEGLQEGIQHWSCCIDSLRQTGLIKHTRALWKQLFG
jgi:hypothetical protein